MTIEYGYGSAILMLSQGHSVDPAERQSSPRIGEGAVTRGTSGSLGETAPSINAWSRVRCRRRGDESISGVRINDIWCRVGGSRRRDGTRKRRLARDINGGNANRASGNWRSRSARRLLGGLLCLCCRGGCRGGRSSIGSGWNENGDGGCSK